MILSFKNIKKLSDEQLVARFKKSGNNAVIGELYERYAALVLGVCLKYLKESELAEDAVSMIFEKLMIDLKKHNVEKFKPWLYMVSKNHCFMYLRAQKMKYASSDNLHILSDDGEKELKEKIAKESTLNALEDAIEELKDDQKVCIQLFYIEKKSYREIEELTNYTLKQIKSHIQNGKRNLKIVLSQSHGQAV